MTALWTYFTSSLLVLLLLVSPAWAQQAVKPVGSNQVQLEPNAFASADAIAAQTASFLHSGMMGWNASTGKWDRIRLDTSDNINVNIAANSFGTLTVQGTGTFDISDRAARLLGVVYGSQAQQLKQTATNFNLATELATGGTLYDARQIRALTSADTVTVTDGSGPMTVDGTITANQGGAPWTVKPDGTVWALTGTSANVAVTNTPTVTANAGTNLNTSALALESGGNLAAAVTALQIIDNVPIADSATFTAASSFFVPHGGEYNSSLPGLTSGQQGTVAVTKNRSQYVTPIDSNALELSTITNPLRVQMSGMSGLVSNGVLVDPTQVNVVTLDAFGYLKSVSAISDGSGRYAALRGPEGAQIQDAGIVVQPSISPAMQCPYVATVSTTSAAQLITNTGGQAIHICTFAVVLAGAESISLVEGTGSTCGTNTKGLYGGTSASASFAANGGSNLISDRIIIPMQTRGDNVCLLKSAANNVSGTITYGLY